MNQLLIVNKAKALNAGATTPNDLSTLQEGAIAFFELGGSEFLSAYPTKNFGIALGRGANMPAFVIPEVDIDTLEIVKATPSIGKNFKAVITIPTVADGKTYTIILNKLGTVPHERMSWTATETIADGDTTTTAANIATKLAKYFQNAAAAGSIDVTVTVSGTTITFTGNDKNQGWTLVAGDALFGTPITDGTQGSETQQNASPVIGDKAYIQKLAQKCAAGKGFNLLDTESRDIYPGYPEAVEDLVPNVSGTEGYAIYNLHFATGRKSGKQVDERVWQYVYIAVPVSGSAYSAIDAILTEAEESNPSDDEQGNG